MPYEEPDINCYLPSPEEIAAQVARLRAEQLRRKAEQESPHLVPSQRELNPIPTPNSWR